ncbi:MAG: cation transporter, partial [Bacteroidia bacterium]
MHTSPNNNIVQKTFPVVGMTCAACAVSLESYLGHLDGVISVVVSYPNQSIFIEFNEEELQEGRLGEAAKEIGYELVTNEADSGNEAGGGGGG